MNCRNIIYSLKNDLQGKVILSTDLSLGILSEIGENIEIQLPTGISTIKKSQYLNKMRIYEIDAKLFFLICDKKVSRQSAFQVLINHSIGKISNRIAKLEALKKEYQLQVA